jgi:hypothetical protein
MSMMEDMTDCCPQDLAQIFSAERSPARKSGAWVRKCFEASQGGALVVLLVPARTDTRWYHDWIEEKAETSFLRGRLRFGGATSSAPFPSMLAVYQPKRGQILRGLWSRFCRSQRC